MKIDEEENIRGKKDRVVCTTHTYTSEDMRISSKSNHLLHRSIFIVGFFFSFFISSNSSDCIIFPSTMPNIAISQYSTLHETQLHIVFFIRRALTAYAVNRVHTQFRWNGQKL